MSAHESDSSPHGKLSMFAALAALGVVFGDIGTSPLYAFRLCFLKSIEQPNPPPIVAQNLIGAASLIVWSLIFIVSIKYVLMILRLDNRGEGGVLALAALLRSKNSDDTKSRWFFGLGLFGAALIYADGVLTPAISVLSAVEGLKVVMPEINTDWIVAISAVILVGLFAIQKFGTHKVGKLFGPIMLIWFLTLGITGFCAMMKTPEVLLSLSPFSATSFLIHEWNHALPLLAAVFLAVTGGEALYADLGHFGRRPIRFAWFAIVFPCLVLNYLGQASILQRNPEVVEHIFFQLVPKSGALPLTILATFAAIIASQALITGAFSLTAQAIQLRCLPRVQIRHTSDTEKGQIYVPSINLLLMVACTILVMIFRSSEALAAAYGVAIALTMTVTSALFWAAAIRIWHWARWQAALVAIVFLIVDFAFLASNGIKILHGGWLPLTMAAVVLIFITTWIWGSSRAYALASRNQMEMPDLLDQISRETIPRVKGFAVFMTGRPDVVPAPLLHNLKHNGILHERVIFLHVVTLDAPTAKEDERFSYLDLGQGICSATMRFGFSEEPNVPLTLKKFMPAEMNYQTQRTSFFLGRETVITNRTRGILHRLRLTLFSSMLRNATAASDYFKLPPNRVVELGSQITL